MKLKMKTKAALLIVLLGLWAHHSDAQTFSPNQLEGTKWKRISPEGGATTTWEFTKTAIEETAIYFVDRPLTGTRKFYLSMDVPTRFDSTKVGKGESGKYLVYYIDKSKRMFYQKIVMLSNDTLKLYKAVEPDAIGGVAHTTIYKKVK